MQLKKICTFYIAVILFFVRVSAQERIVFVKDEKTNLPVAAASIVSDDNAVSTFTDDDGRMNIAQIPASVKYIRVSSVGYASRIFSPDSLKGTVFLSPTSTALKEVEITSAQNKVFQSFNALDIRVNPITTSQDVMRMVPGLFIAQHAGGGKAEQLFLRGFDLDHGTDIAVSVEGIPVNAVSHAHGQGYCDLHWVIPEMIEAMDFDKGPYNASKGNLATSGWINFKLKDYFDKSFVKIEGGQYMTGRIVAGLNLIDPRRFGGYSLIFGGEASYTQNYFVNNQKFSRFNGMLRYIMPTGKNGTLNILATGFYSQWWASGQVPERAVSEGLTSWFGSLDPSEGGQTSRINASATHVWNFKNGGVMKNQIFYSYYQFNLYSNFTFYLEDTVNGDEIEQHESRNIIGYNGSYKQKNYWGKLPVETEVGAYLREDIIDSIGLAHVVKRQFLNNIMLGNVRETDAAVYAIQNYQITPKFTISAGIRGDYFWVNYQDFLANTNRWASAGTISPKLNFTYKFNDKIMLYQYNGKGFHSNDARVVVPEKGRQILPAAWGNDLGIVVKPLKNLMFQAAVWNLWMKQEFVYVGDEGVVEPNGKSERFGVDFSGRYEAFKGFFIDVNVNYSHGRMLGTPKGQNYIPLAPTLTSTGGITYRMKNGFNGSLRYRAMANRPGNEDYSLTATGYFIGDLTLNYTRPKWEIGVMIQNLFNSKWKEAQFETDTRLRDKNGVLESAPVVQMDFTPGTPIFVRAHGTIFF